VFFKKKKDITLTDEYKESVRLEEEKLAEIEELNYRIAELERTTKNLAIDTGAMDSVWNVAEQAITCCREIGYGCNEDDKITNRTIIEKGIDFLNEQKGRLTVNNSLYTYIDNQLNRLLSEKKKWGIDLL